MSIYVPPLTHLDRIIKRPFEHIMAIVILFSSVTKLLSGGPLVAAISHPAVAVAWASLGLIAGVLILLGLHWRSPIMGRAIERVGWTFAAMMTLGGAVLVGFVDPSLIPYAVDDAMLGVGAILRNIFIRREQKAERVAHRLMQAHEAAMDGDA